MSVNPKRKNGGVMLTIEESCVGLNTHVECIVGFQELNWKDTICHPAWGKLGTFYAIPQLIIIGIKECSSTIRVTDDPCPNAA